MMVPSWRQRSLWKSDVIIFFELHTGSWILPVWWSWLHVPSNLPAAHRLPLPTTQLHPCPPRGSQGLCPTLASCATCALPFLVHALAQACLLAHHTAAGVMHWTHIHLWAAARGQARDPGKSWSSLSPSQVVSTLSQPLPQTTLTECQSPHCLSFPQSENQGPWQAFKALHNLSHFNP